MNPLGQSVADDLFQQMIALDDRKEHGAMLSLLKSAGLSEGQRQALFLRVFETQRLAACYVVAVAILEAGSDGVAIRLVEFLGSLLFSDGRRCDGAVARIRQLAPADPTGRKRMRRYLEPMVSAAVLNLFTAGRDDAVLRVLDAWMPLADGVAAAFGGAEPRAQAPGRLLTFPEPPLLRRQRKVVVAGRRYLYTVCPGSRELDLGPRLVHAVAAYGWQPSFVPMATFITGPALDDEFRRIAARCRETGADVLALDEFTATPATERCVAELRALKRDLPHLKIIVVYFDPWSLDEEVILRTIDEVDYVWNLFPSNSLFRTTVMAGKVFDAPYPTAGMSGSPDTVALDGHMVLAGAVSLYNWHRAFWIAAARRDGLPVELQRTSHGDDGLSVLDSYRDYFRRLEAAGCCLNFSMRLHESRILTGRLFEALLAGALLVQEAADDIPYFFTAGEHYLSFSDYREFQEIARFIRNCPAEAEAIRRRGHAFAHQHYSDERIMGCLDHFLFHGGWPRRDHGSNAAP